MSKLYGQMIEKQDFFLIISIVKYILHKYLKSGMTCKIRNFSTENPRSLFCLATAWRLCHNVKDYTCNSTSGRLGREVGEVTPEPTPLPTADGIEGRILFGSGFQRIIRIQSSQIQLEVESQWTLLRQSMWSNCMSKKS